jgi:hypothetical protein
VLLADELIERAWPHSGGKRGSAVDHFFGRFLFAEQFLFHNRKIAQNRQLLTQPAWPSAAGAERLYPAGESLQFSPLNGRFDRLGK